MLRRISNGGVRVNYFVENNPCYKQVTCRNKFDYFAQSSRLHFMFRFCSRFRIHGVFKKIKESTDLIFKITFNVKKIRRIRKEEVRKNCNIHMIRCMKFEYQAIPRYCFSPPSPPLSSREMEENSQIQRGFK